MDSHKSTYFSENAVPLPKCSGDGYADKSGESIAEEEGKTIDDAADMFDESLAEGEDKTMDDRTQEYEVDEQDHVQKTVSYSKLDFKTDSDDHNDGDDDVQTQEGHGRRPKIDETMESSHTKFRQTTLNFGNYDTDRDTKSKRRHTRSSHRRWNDDDTACYRKGYPGLKDDPSLNHNLEFYTGKMSSYPDGDFIDNIHNHWFGDYRLLENHHGFIQWLFPIREHGMNYQAQPLQLHEAKAIQEDKTAHKRVLTSFKLMLDFYGMKLDDEVTGKISRSHMWKKQYDNFNRSSHNHLRITRILKCLGELGFEHLKKPFLWFILEEIFHNRTLTRTLKSFKDYWIGTLKNDEDREVLHVIIDDNDDS